jgi:mono/diheme cytochrome c family protein
MKYSSLNAIMLFAAIGMITACGGGDQEGGGTTEAPQSMVKKAEVDPMDNTGIGPISELNLPAEIDQDMAAKGKEIYDLKCTACHKPTEKFIGPAPQGIFERRNPAWVMNMILNPDQMVKEDPLAKKLLMEYNGSPMANQNLSEEEARAVVEYFRTI